MFIDLPRSIPHLLSFLGVHESVYDSGYESGLFHVLVCYGMKSPDINYWQTGGYFLLTTSNKHPTEADMEFGHGAYHDTYSYLQQFSCL